MRCEIPPIARRSSLNRRLPFPRRLTTSTDHLSPMRDNTSLIGLQSLGRWMFSGFKDVPSCAMAFSYPT
jgi:hypothetical protein